MNAASQNYVEHDDRREEYKRFYQLYRLVVRLSISYDIKEGFDRKKPKYHQEINQQWYYTCQADGRVHRRPQHPQTQIGQFHKIAVDVIFAPKSSECAIAPHFLLDEINHLEK